MEQPDSPRIVYNRLFTSHDLRDDPVREKLGWRARYWAHICIYPRTSRYWHINNEDVADRNMYTWLVTSTGTSGESCGTPSGLFPIVMCIQTTNILNDRNDRFHLFYPPARWGPLDSNKGATSSPPSPSTFTFFLLLHLLLSASSFCQLIVTLGIRRPRALDAVGHAWTRTHARENAR